MKEITRLRKLQADCRRRAQSEPERKWHWLAQAAKYQIQASLEIAQHVAETQQLRIVDEIQRGLPLPEGIPFRALRRTILASP